MEALEENSAGDDRAACEVHVVSWRYQRGIEDIERFL